MSNTLRNSELTLLYYIGNVERCLGVLLLLTDPAWRSAAMPSLERRVGAGYFRFPGDDSRDGGVAVRSEMCLEMFGVERSRGRPHRSG